MGKPIKTVALEDLDAAKMEEITQRVTKLAKALLSAELSGYMDGERDLEVSTEEFVLLLVAVATDIYASSLDALAELGNDLAEEFKGTDKEPFVGNYAKLAMEMYQQVLLSKIVAVAEQTGSEVKRVRPSRNDKED